MEVAASIFLITMSVCAMFLTGMFLGQSWRK